MGLKGAAYKSYESTRRCRQCGEDQELVAYRRSKKERIDVCRSCELLQYKACGIMLSQHNFTPKDIDHYFSDAQKVVCLECKSRGCSARRPSLYLCAGPCSKLLGSAAYAAADLSRRKKDPTHIMYPATTYNVSQGTQLTQLSYPQTP